MGNRRLHVWNGITIAVIGRSHQSIAGRHNILLTLFDELLVHSVRCQRQYLTVLHLFPIAVDGIVQLCVLAISQEVLDKSVSREASILQVLGRARGIVALTLQFIAAKDPVRVDAMGEGERGEGQLELGPE